MSNTIGRAAGYITGLAVAPIAAAASFVRRARVFHPRGVMLHGSARVVAAMGPFRELGTRLSGPVLVRFSAAWWKRREWPDVLGCAVRFTDVPDFSSHVRDNDQDLLLATVRHPFTTLLAPLTTRVGDYLSNDYFGVSPFRTPEFPRLWFRLKPLRPGGLEGQTREAKLCVALAGGPISLQLQARADRNRGEFHDVATIDLLERVELDQRAFAFDPFQAGRDLHPQGFIHNLRAATYAASRTARRTSERPNAPTH